MTEPHGPVVGLSGPEPVDLARQPVLTARLVFDASVGEWLCEMTDTEDPGEGRFVGSGPDPLAAALGCAEIASAAWWARRSLLGFLGSPPKLQRSTRRRTMPADLSRREPTPEVELACPWCSGSIFDEPCGKDHARLAMEARQSPMLLAFAVGAVLEKARLEAEHRTEWAVLSDDGATYEVEGKTQQRAEYEAGLLRLPDPKENGYHEPTARVLERRVCAWAGTSIYDPPLSATEGVTR